ncbi:von Willebrand factor A domain-containing protein 7 isoform X2 [Nothobranchius furzeri]|uniref:von Willebrand factor A domain-containing protein 7 isoform X2 n=1 Tax=Nothobranchius furzeri TaxID=105023 RepID=UPI002403B0F1|nr:von Willebrand factor A domain-containing protein 7 isoform X2 [Nothobranchius furzeri]
MKNTPTCVDCFTPTCRNNLLPALANPQGNAHLLTTGYDSYSKKPKGKCSHGGIMDRSQYLSARGGINKDSTSPLFSPHHYLHMEAAKMATNATLSLLRDLKDTVGPEVFLKLFRVKQVPALVFVMDTTGSMFEEITAARLRAHSIIQNRANGTEHPGTFLLVPFHDPGFGPVYEADDPNQFMEFLENLMALGGGDEPEMSLSAIQLALTHSPPLSEIFVFTDASAKDDYLFDAVKALALEKQSKITFLLTEDPSHTTRVRRKRRSKDSLSPDRFALYSSLSSLSGGMTIFTTNSDIHRVSAVVEDNIAVNKVTLLHVKSDQELMPRHSFRVDSSVKKVTIHVTGTMTECILTSPSAQTQFLLRDQGPMAEVEYFQGLYRISLSPPVQPGQWHLQAMSNDHITFNVIADSSVDFLYYFASAPNETHPGLSRVEGCPVAGAPVFLVLTVNGVTSAEQVSFDAMLLGTEGQSLHQVKLDRSSSGSFSTLEELVGFVDSVPAVPFYVQLRGTDVRGNKLERASTEMVLPSHIQIQTSSAPHLVPGHRTTVDFDILNHGPARLFNLTADDDCGYLLMRGPHRFHVEKQGSFHGQVYLLTPASAQAGVTVTLTLTVHAHDPPESNYAVVYLTVVPLNADASPPSCSVVRVQSDCTEICSQSSWSVSLAVSDSRSGLAALQVHKGEGVLTLFHSSPPAEHSTGEAHSSEQQHAHKNTATSRGLHHQYERHNYRARLKTEDPPLNVSKWTLDSSQPLWVTYTSTCCSDQAEVLVWNSAGNMKRCPLTSGQQRRHKDRSTESSGAGRAKLTIVSLLLVLLWPTRL